MTKSQFQLAFQKFMKIYETLGLLAVYVASYYKVLLKCATFVCKRQSRAPLLHTYTHPVQYMNNRLLCNSILRIYICTVLYAISSTPVLNSKHSLHYNIFSFQVLLFFLTWQECITSLVKEVVYQAKCIKMCMKEV